MSKSVDKSALFRRAWGSARALAALLGGTARSYLGRALRQAWASLRAPALPAPAVMVRRLSGRLGGADGQYVAALNRRLNAAARGGIAVVWYPRQVIRLAALWRAAAR